MVLCLRIRIAFPCKISFALHRNSRFFDFREIKLTLAMEGGYPWSPQPWGCEVHEIHIWIDSNGWTSSVATRCFLVVDMGGRLAGNNLLRTGISGLNEILKIQGLFGREWVAAARWGSFKVFARELNNRFLLCLLWEEFSSLDLSSFDVLVDHFYKLIERFLNAGGDVNHNLVNPFISFPRCIWWFTHASRSIVWSVCDGI